MYAGGLEFAKSHERVGFPRNGIFVGVVGVKFRPFRNHVSSQDV